MLREYRKWWSPQLGREMELLIFGEGGRPLVAFPSSQGRFFDLEDRGLIHAVSEKLEAGRIQIFCLDSVDTESWYNRTAPPRMRIVRHLQYESYVMEEVLPLVNDLHPSAEVGALGCSFGGYHAVNLALRHPDRFTSFLSMSGAFDLSGFPGGYYDQDVYFHLPTHYLPNLTDPWYLDRLRRGNYILATGWDDPCLGDNQHLSRLLEEKAIPHELHVWEAPNSHDWLAWAKMMQEYL